MKLEKQSPTTDWNNFVIGELLTEPESAATYSFTQHGTDGHLVQVIVSVNTYSGFNFTTKENPSCNRGPPNSSATSWDLEKVFKHEFFHVMGFYHSFPKDSMIYDGGYICDTGSTFYGHDLHSIQTKYQAGVQ